MALNIGLWMLGEPPARDLIIYTELSIRDSLQRQVERYRAEHGRLPTVEHWQEEVGSQGVTTDARGEPFIYRLTDGPPGFVLYSTGANRRDEGGAGDDISGREKAYSCAAYGVDCPKPWLTRFAEVVQLLPGLCVFALLVTALYGGLSRRQKVRMGRQGA